MNSQNGSPIPVSDEWEHRNDPDASPPASAVVEDTVLLGDLALQSDQPDQSRSAEVEDGQPLLEEASDEIATIRSELAVLRAETVHVNQILDRLHAENERLRRGETEMLLQPLFRDLLKLADDWTAMAASWESKESATPADVVKKCLDVAEDARLILERYGVESFAPAVGAPIERRQHRVVSSVKAETPEAENTVAVVRRAGYVYHEKVIRFAEVVAAR
jgi:molecular chaperone GrpE (heat shock protein)